MKVRSVPLSVFDYAEGIGLPLSVTYIFDNGARWHYFFFSHGLEVLANLLNFGIEAMM